MASHPTIDVNLFVYNGGASLRPVLESLLRQTWPNFEINLLDDGSTDETPRILAEYVPRFSSARLTRNTCNGGPVAAFQWAFRTGRADFVMPKSGDDPIAPDFIARLMETLLVRPDCAMCHAAGCIWDDGKGIIAKYPDAHRLLAIGREPVARANAVMRSYTSSPAFWGIYRRRFVDRLAPILYRAGWDHALLAELALYGEIRHVPEVLYWRRGGGAPVLALARRASLARNRGISLKSPLADSRWRTPLITTAYAHLETFAVARVDEATRQRLMASAPTIFRERWMPRMMAEARALRQVLPSLIAAIRSLRPELAPWAALELGQTVRAVRTILPEQGFWPELQELWGPPRQDHALEAAAI